MSIGIFEPSIAIIIVIAFAVVMSGNGMPPKGGA